MFAVIFMTFLLVETSSAQLVEGWGTVVDPLRDCRVEKINGMLKITVPGTLHDLHTGMDAPRVVQELDGDFVSQVCVKKFSLPGKNTWADQRAPVDFVSSGLLVYLDDKQFIRFERTGSFGERGQRVTVWGKLYREGKDVAYARVEIADEDAFLKVERTEGNVKLAYSSDSKTWIDFPLTRWREGESFYERPERKDEVVMKNRVRVGVYSINATKFAISHEFTNFKLLR
jgi:regulation of enolase protein 1 (concanavalin A-like superfamily)